TLTQAVIDAFAAGTRGVEILAVGSDSSTAGVLDRARAHDVATFVVRPKDFADRQAWNEQLRRTVAELGPDWVVSAGFMRILGPSFVEAFSNRIINTHPALLPSFPGAHGVRDALAHGVKLTGGTIHLVDTGVDTGPIITQYAVPSAMTTPKRPSTNASRPLRGKSSCVCWPTSPTPISSSTVGMSADMPPRRRPQTDPSRAKNRPANEPQGGSVTGTRAIRRALISVYDKTGLEDLARGLDAAGVQIVSTGSTAAKIAEAGAEVTKVEDLTGFPECLEGRVKTLHPRVHAGILADSRKPDHRSQLDELGIEPFDLVIVNLYPFSDTVASGAGFDDCVEQIDIGGPSM